ncbi:MAG: nitroreductase family protein, partial [Bdellovibrionales bacterium]|nr:nitroreductase family protein [Bdellovibrionales bacterium]
MKIKEVIATRRTIHDYLNQDFDFGWVEEAVTLALLAPNHRASFPWVFYVLEAETKRSVISLELELKSLDKKLSSAQTQLIEKKYRDPKVIMALGMKRTENQQQSREDYASIACGVQNISLFLWAKGIGCK